jgi:hypothetical protein
MVRCADVVGMGAEDYAASVLLKVCDQEPPEGVFYLVWWMTQADLATGSSASIALRACIRRTVSMRRRASWIVSQTRWRRSPNPFKTGGGSWSDRSLCVARPRDSAPSHLTRSR